MGRLTDDMADLRMNIDNSRDSRLAQRNALVSEVNFQLAEFASIRARNGAQDAQTRADFITQNANDVGRLLTAFRHSRQMMRRQGRETRADFLSKMSKDTLDLLTSFNADRKSMAERNAKDRADFIANMTNTVAAFINEAAQDRAGAHAAFFGTAPSKKKNDFPPRIAIRLNEPVVEKQETVSPVAEVKSSEPSEQAKPALSFVPQEDLTKMETFFESYPEVNETKKPRRKHSEHSDVKKDK